MITPQASKIEYPIDSFLTQINYKEGRAEAIKVILKGVICSIYKYK